MSKHDWKIHPGRYIVCDEYTENVAWMCKKCKRVCLVVTRRVGNNPIARNPPTIDDRRRDNIRNCSYEQKVAVAAEIHEA